MATPLLSSFYVRGDRDLPAEIFRETAPPLVRHQPPDRHRAPAVRESQRAARAMLTHDDTGPRPARDEACLARCFARLHANLVLADLQPLEIRVMQLHDAKGERQEGDF